MKKVLDRCFLFCLAGIWVFSSLAAQTTSTEILGLVRDTTGGVIPGADVTITRVATGQVRRGVTNESGQYSFPLIEPGVYRVHVEMPGFRPHTVTGINVQFQQRARVNVVLEVGELTDVVEVVAGAHILHTDEASVGLNIEGERIVELPTLTRNIGHLAVMVPGVTFGGRMGRFDGMGGQSPPGTAVALVAHGQHEINQTISLDGVDAKEPRIHTMSLMPSLDAVAEFRVQTAAYSAEYGLGGGAHVQISMKSGTNDFHGSLYDFVRNSAMDAEHYFLNFELAPGEERRPKQALRRHQFGAFLSGPVILPGYDGRNRTFWSFNYEGRRELSEAVQTAWYPSEAMRRGDFSEILLPVDAEGIVLRNRFTGAILRSPIVIFDPLTGEPFPGNVIPEDRIHPGARNILDNFVPQQQFRQEDPLDFTNRGVVAPTIRQNAWFFRVDHTFSEKDRVFVRLAWDHQQWDRPALNPHSGLFYFNKPLNLASQWIHTFSPSVLNEFRFGIQQSEDDTQHRRVNEDFNQDALGIGPFRVVGDGNRPLIGRENGIPPLGLFGLGDGGEGAGINDMRTYNFANHLSVLRGDHSFKMGFEYRQPRIDRLAANLTRGSLAFSALQGGNTTASFLMGFPNSATTAEGLPLTVTQQHLWSLYFMDTWRVTPSFTANLGLRYDYIGVPIDTEGLWRTFDFQRTFTTPDGSQIPTIFPTSLGSAGAIPLFEQDNRFFMPRVGLAYRPADKWVIRAGTGWYANITLGNNFTILNLMPPRSGTLTFSNIMDVAQTFQMEVEDQTFNITTRQFRPGTDIVALGDQLFDGPVVVRPENVLHVQPDRRNSSHWTWSFDVQRELPLNTALTVGYVGSKSHHLPNSIGNWNQAPPSPDTNIQARRPIQHFHDPLRPEIPVRDLNNIRFLDSGATAWYNSLVVSADRRFSRGLAYGLSYTFSKAIGEGQGGGQEGVSFQDPLDRVGSKGPQPFHRPHVAVVNFVYELPFMRQAPGLARGVLGGWQLSGILAFRSGFPYTVAGSNPLNTDGPSRPDRIDDGRLDNPTRERWFDPQAFQRVSCNIPSRPDLCRFGNSGIGIIPTPSEKKLDLAVHKNFYIAAPGAEDMRLQFRVEAFNAFNTPFFGDPTNIGFSTADTIVPDSLRGGEIRSLRTPMRIMQVALKLMW